MVYRVEYDKSGRAGCKGPKPCKGTKIPKGSLRFGTVVEINGNTTFMWRHWGCVTSRVLTNIKKSCPEPADVDGYEELIPEDQAKMDQAWIEGFVDPADIPPSAVKAEGDAETGEEGATPKKKAKPRKSRKSKAEPGEGDDDAAEEDVKPKKKRAPKKAAPKKKAKKDDSESELDLPDESDEEEAEMTPDESEEDYTPARKKSKGRASAGGKKKKRAQMASTDDDEDDDDDESAEEVMPVPKKRGRPSSAKVKPEAGSDEDAPPSAKKARGRPSKTKAKVEEDRSDEEEDVKPTIDAESEEEDVKPKKRGRK